MNWYKIAQQLNVVDTRDLKGRGKHYTGIAHDINYGEQNRLLGFDPNENYSIDEPNILWVYNNGQIETRPETQENQTHRSRGNWYLNSNLDRLYTGRYSPSENIITLIPPHEGLGRYRELPEQLKFLLKQKFPKAVDIYNYDSSKSWFKKAQNDNYFYVINCVSSDAEDIGYMVDNATEIPFEEFINNVNNEEFREMEFNMGYPANDFLKEMKDDYAVSFWHSLFRGVDAYYFDHSRVEYVFTLNGQMGNNQDYDELI